MGFEKGRWAAVLMAAIAAIYLLGSLVLMNTSDLYVSPDETANAFFSKQFAQTFSLRGPVDSFAAEFNGRIHPRSALSLDGSLVPGSFVGLPIVYGFIAMIVGPWILWFLTPMLTIATAFAFRHIVGKKIKEPIGTLIFVLFLLHPAVWYYSARGLMHNVLFVDFFVLAAWLWIVRPMIKSPTMGDLLAGFLLGLAVVVRTSEFAWIAGALIIAAIIWRRSLSWRRIRASALGMIIALAILLGINAVTYGDPFSTGYTLWEAGVGSVEDENLSLESLSYSPAFLLSNFFPFGLHPRDAWRHFSAYGVSMFWWLSVLSAIGFFVALGTHKHRRTIAGALGIGALISVWLVLMYGSWEIHDNPDPTQITMANSYARYWLPMFLFSTPLMALAIDWLSHRARSLFARRVLMSALLLAVVGLNVRAVFVQGQDGLLMMKRELAKSAQIQQIALAIIPPEAVVIVDRADKLFFPHRRVWYPLRDDATYAAMPQLVAQAPLYYYGITLPDADLAYLNWSRLKKMGLQIELIQTFDDESLYHITVP